MTPCDVAVIGGGPAGSTLATLLGKQGRKVVLFEKETFPRFHIGESLLPYSMPVFRETGFFDILNSGKYIKKYGARFVDGSTESEICFEFKNGLDPNENLAFEVPRAEFDSDLLKWARECGVEVSQPDRVTRLDFLADHVAHFHEMNGDLIRINRRTATTSSRALAPASIW